MLRRILIGLATCSVLLIAAVFAGPVSSGAVLLLLPTTQEAKDHDLPESYEPFHKGHVSLDNGFYYQRDETLIVRGTPPLVLRRSYISSYRVQKEFGIGTTMAGEWYMVGDGKKFQWAALIRPGESHIRFERTSPGSSVFNAMYRHTTSAGEWFGARLGWTGIDFGHCAGMMALARAFGRAVPTRRASARSCAIATPTGMSSTIGAIAPAG